jgi:hypothetical protein
VVLVALQNEALDATYEELSTEYPKVEFRKVCEQLLQAPAVIHFRCLLAQLAWQL